MCLKIVIHIKSHISWKKTRLFFFASIPEVRMHLFKNVYFSDGAQCKKKVSTHADYILLNDRSTNEKLLKKEVFRSLYNEHSAR